MTMLPRLIAIIIALGLHHGHRDADRLEQVARDVWDAAEVAPVFCGPAMVEATALLLTAVAWHESGFHPKVQNCTYNQRDPAVSLFALQGPVAWDGYTRGQICADNALAARLSTLVLSRYRRAGSILTMARGYASGDPSIKSRAAREIADLVARLHWGERIVTTYQSGCLTASYRSDP